MEDLAEGIVPDRDTPSAPRRRVECGTGFLRAPLEFAPAALLRGRAPHSQSLRAPTRTPCVRSVRSAESDAAQKSFHHFFFGAGGSGSGFGGSGSGKAAGLAGEGLGASGSARGGEDFAGTLSLGARGGLFVP